MVGACLKVVFWNVKGGSRGGCVHAWGGGEFSVGGNGLECWVSRKGHRRHTMGGQISKYPGVQAKSRAVIQGTEIKSDKLGN